MNNRTMSDKSTNLYRMTISVVLAITFIFSLAFSTVAETEQPSNNQLPAVKLAAGFSHSGMIDYDGSLYLWGDNTYGQAAAGEDSYIDQPQLINLGVKAADISLGAWHTLVLTENGEVYSSGRNTFGQLGNGTWENSRQLAKIEGLSNIVAIEAGSYHSLALSEDGGLWVWGSNTSGQLAHADSEELKDNDQIVARRNARPEKIIDSGVKQIAAGGHFTLYVDQNGKVFGFGDNSKGQLGVGTTENSDLPIQVADIENVIRIEAGYEYALAIVQTASTQELYAWGDNSLGQLGIVGAMRTRPSAVKLPAELAEYDKSLFEIGQLTAGYSHVLMTVPEQLFAVDSETKTKTAWFSGYQHLLAWGSNAFGQLGSSASTQVYTQPGLIKTATEAEDTVSFLAFDTIAAGGSHSLVMSSIGQLAASGRGNQGQLGTVSIIDRSMFTPVETSDHILPAWGSDQKLTAKFNEDGELNVTWQPAQNNRSETLYRVEIKSADGKRQLLECGAKTSRNVPNLDPAKPLAIRIYAYDTASEELTNDQLSLLYGSYMPEDFTAELWAESFDQPITGAISKTVVNQSWTPDPAGNMRFHAVPWKQTSTYNTQIVLNDLDDKIPVLSIIIMILSAIVIIAAAVWLAINFNKERSLIYPLTIPESIKAKFSSLTSAISKKSKVIINMLKDKASIVLSKAKLILSKLKEKLSKYHKSSK